MSKWLKLVYPKSIFRKGDVVSDVVIDMQITIANAMQHIDAVGYGVCADTPLKKDIEYEVTVRIRDLEE